MNSFNKEERVAWEQLLEGFEDGCILSKNVSVYRTEASMMERANNTIWRPMPYIAQSFSGTDMTANFVDNTQLAVPAQINRNQSSPWKMTATDLNDALQEGRLGKSASQKLSSDINIAIMDTASNSGTLVVKRTTAASGFDDVAQCDAIMNEQGIAHFDRHLALSTRDYNGMASNLAARQTMQGRPETAYDKAYVGNVSGFETLKLDYANSLTAALGVSVTMNGANQYYTPLAIRTAATGETSNVDNRYQNINITVGSGTVKVGDAFVIAGVNAVHHITKLSTGQPKTFRVMAIVSGAGATGTIQISPPIISAGGGTSSELQYKNVDATPADGAAITFLNTVDARINPFWHKDSLEILPGRFVIPTDTGAAVMKSTTSQGFDVTMMKQFDIKNRMIFYRIDVFFGVVNLNPEMTGIMLFSQS